MGLRSRVASWWRGATAGRTLNQEMEAEFAHHIEQRTAHLIRLGVAPAAAARRARLEFGSTETARQQGRGSRGLWYLDELRGDARYGARALRRDPGFAIVAVLTLALGIGATTAIFTALDAVVLRGLPFPEADRLVVVEGVNIPFRFGDFEPPKSQPDILEAQALAAFADLSAYAPGAMNLSGSGPPRRVNIGAVTVDFFATLGVQPTLGRAFEAEEGVPNGPAVAIVSHGFWQRQLGSATNLEPQGIMLNGRRYAVVGVMPRGFGFPEESEVWIPLSVPTTSASFEPFRQYLPSRVIARLAPGVGIEQAQQQVDALHAPYDRPDRARALTPAEQVTPLHATLVRDRDRVLLVLLGATALVLLIACANVANLLLSRSSARRRELAVRAALGATPARVMRQFLAESLLLAGVGGAVGLALAYGGVQLLEALVPRGLLGATPLRIDIRVLAFAAGITILTGLVFGLLPALGARRADAGEALKSGSAGAAGTQAPRARQALVLAEVALAAMLLVGSALMLRSMHALLSTDTGVQPERVATLELSLAPAEYPNAASRTEFYERVVERLSALPQVAHAAAINELPLRGVGSVRVTVHPEGRPPETMDMRHMAQDLRITPDYFDAMGIRVLLGRAPRPRLNPDAPMEVTINQELAGMHWPGENPVGQYLAGAGGTRIEIVGVVANVLPTSLTSAVLPQTYHSLLDGPYQNAALIVRGRVAGGTLTRLLEQTVREVAPNQAVYNVRTMEQVIGSTLRERRTNTWLLVSFGALAMLLAGIGVYGVVSFSVARRTREIGIRIALGARATQVRGEIMREAGALALVGIVAGVAAAWMLSSVLSGMIHGITVRDPLAFTVAPLVLVLAAALAVLVPAQRATRVDPMAAIRVE